MLLFNFYRINWLRQVGLLDAWRHQFWPRPNKCSDPMEKKAPSSNDIKPMSLNQSKGPFILLCAGITVSFFIFLCELALNRVCIKRNNVNRG